MAPVPLFLWFVQSTSILRGRWFAFSLSGSIPTLACMWCTQDGFTGQTCYHFIPLRVSSLSLWSLLLCIHQLFTGRIYKSRLFLYEGLPSMKKSHHILAGGGGVRFGIRKFQEKYSHRPWAWPLSFSNQASGCLIWLGLTDFPKITYFGFMILSLQAVFTICICRNRECMPGTRQGPLPELTQSVINIILGWRLKLMWIISQ